MFACNGSHKNVERHALSFAVHACGFYMCGTWSVVRHPNKGVVGLRRSRLPRETQWKLQGAQAWGYRFWGDSGDFSRDVDGTHAKIANMITDYDECHPNWHLEDIISLVFSCISLLFSRNVQMPKSWSDTWSCSRTMASWQDEVCRWAKELGWSSVQAQKCLQLFRFHLFVDLWLRGMPCMLKKP